MSPEFPRDPTPTDEPRRVTITEYFKQTPAEFLPWHLSAVGVDALPTTLEELEAIIAEKYPPGHHAPLANEPIDELLSVIRASSNPDAMVQMLLYSREEDGRLVLGLGFPHPGIEYS